MGARHAPATGSGMNRITPRWLYFGMAASIGAAAIAHFVFDSASAEWISLGSKEAAYFLATAFCLKIAAEYRRQPMLRLACLLLAANAVVSMVRHVLEMGISDQLPHMHLYRQIAITLALLFLLGGM